MSQSKLDCTIRRGLSPTTRLQRLGFVAFACTWALVLNGCASSPSSSSQLKQCLGNYDCLSNQACVQGVCEARLKGQRAVCLGEQDCPAVSDTDDTCPLDPRKTAPGECGCGTPDLDSDADGTFDCDDACPNNAQKTEPEQGDCSTELELPALEESYAVAGSVRGLSEGNSLVIQNNAHPPVTLSTNGVFELPILLPTGALYQIGIVEQPVDQTQECSIAESSGSIGGSRVDTLEVICACSANHRVQNGTCVACDTDSVRSAGDDPTQLDTDCTPKPSATCDDGTPNGQSQARLRYNVVSTAVNDTCTIEPQARICTNGTWGAWTGTYTHDTCPVLVEPEPEPEPEPTYAVVVNEFMAANKTTSVDETDVFGDWIEVYNQTTTAISLDGWTITDDFADPFKQSLTGLVIEAGGYLVLLADGGNAVGHLSFALAKDGEDIGLYDPNGVAQTEYTYGAQIDDQSTSRVKDGAEIWAITSTPTPGASNN
jgi:hypothetical protein